MKHLEKFNESVKNKDYIVKSIVISPSYARDMPKKVGDEIYKLVNHNNQFKRYYPGDGYYKPLSEHKDPSKAIFYQESDKNEKDPYAYEMGSDTISDWLFDEGFTPKDDIIFLISW